MKHASKLTVVRVLDGTYKEATANIPTGSGTYYTGSSIGGHFGSTDSEISLKLQSHEKIFYPLYFYFYEKEFSLFV